jgi:hypothetical protein
VDFFLVIFIVLFGSAQAFVLAFGTQLEEYRTCGPPLPCVPS